ncbi:MAG: LSU ribosomal protein L35p, partial [uncultured Arthrobacter sp.]
AEDEDPQWRQEALQADRQRQAEAPAGQPPPLPRAQVLDGDPSSCRRQDCLQGRHQGHQEDARRL